MDGAYDPRLLLSMPEQSGSWERQRDLLEAAEQLLPQVLQHVGRYQGDFTSTDERNPRKYFLAQNEAGKEISVWVDAVPLPGGMVARTLVNTTSDHYMIHVSDRVPLNELGRVLSHGTGEFLACRERSAAGLAPVMNDMLQRGPELPVDRTLSATDRGQIGQLNWLAERHFSTTPEAGQQEQARTAFSALIDRCGLRPTQPLDASEAVAREADAADIRVDYATPHMSAQAKRLMRELARPIEHLSPADASALSAYRRAEAEARGATRVAAFVGGQSVTVPLPGLDANGLPLPQSRLSEKAAAWAAARTERTVVTEEQLRDAALRHGGWAPPQKVIIGGGASLTGRDPDALLIDARGRWHLDPGAGIVQSADQTRDMAQAGLEDPHTYTAPTGRVPIEAARAWEDELAVRGPVVDGYGRLSVDADGRLVVRIQPQSGGGHIGVEVDGAPIIATGLTPEVVPGVARDSPSEGLRGVESLGEAVRVLDERIQGLAGVDPRSAAAVRQQLLHTERSGGRAADVLGVLDAAGIRQQLGDDRAIRDCFQTLEATQKWEEARAAAPGRALLGDEVADNRFDPRAAQHWIVAGSGGTGVANAEIILRENPDARVTIMGGEAPPALHHQVQYLEMTHEDSPYMTSGRLDIKQTRLGAVETVPGPDGKPLFRVPFKDENGNMTAVVADGYVASLGRTNPLPPATRELAERVRDAGAEVRGTLLFDEHQQYLGYGLTFPVDGREHRVNVTGAASWQLPREVFDQQTVVKLGAMGVRQVPSESANAAPGFAPVAHQSAAYARARAAGTVTQASQVPERWVGPAPSAESTAPAARHSAGGTPAQQPNRSVAKAAKSRSGGGGRSFTAQPRNSPKPGASRPQVPPQRPGGPEQGGGRRR
ncbi:hypothetical protein ABZ840_28290 [Streptomyces sp. NPDC047117]|uniref:hypothetical protein n=1 Tax=Streptomyces sp. NPDC047117 TaxID=3155379 RepID=UPI00340D3AC1